MRIKAIDWRNKPREFNSFEDYFQNCLSDTSYDSGQLESAAQQARNNTAAIGRLVEILTQKGILDGADVAVVAGHGRYNELELLKD